MFDGSALKTLVIAPEVSIDSEIPEASSELLFWTTIPIRIASRSSSSMSFWILVMWTTMSPMRSVAGRAMAKAGGDSILEIVPCALQRMGPR